MSFEHGRLFKQDYLPIIATDPEQARLATQVSVAARKFVSFAAAATVQDVRSYVENQRKSAIPTKQISDVLSILPGLKWLDSCHRWFTFVDVEFNRTLQRAAVIIALAGVPVEYESLYWGLVRESKRPTTGKSTGFVDPFPPPHVFRKILDAHPAFERRNASTFSLKESLDPFAHLEGFQRELVRCIERHGGIATIFDLRTVRRKDGTRIKEDYLGATLYLGYFLCRLGTSL